jgi:hypothetical protein
MNKCLYCGKDTRNNKYCNRVCTNNDPKHIINLRNSQLKRYEDPEQHRKQSDKMTQLYIDKPEICDKISKGTLGKKHSEETKNKIRK